MKQHTIVISTFLYKVNQYFINGSREIKFKKIELFKHSNITIHKVNTTNQYNNE